MSTLVRNSGIVGGSNLRFGSRLALNAPDGTAILVIDDVNDATSVNGDKTGVEKIYVYSSTDRATWTLRATINAPVTGGRVTADVSPSGVVGIVNWSATVLRYIPVTISDWSVGAAETVRTALTSPVSENDFDVAFTDASVAVITAIRTNTSGTTRCQVYSYVRTAANTFTATAVATVETSNNPKTANQAVSGIVTSGGSATSRPYVFAVGHGTSVADGGVDLYTALLNETSGAVTSITKRATYAQDVIPTTSTASRSRDVHLFMGQAAGEYNLGIQHTEGNLSIGAARGTWTGSAWTSVINYTSVTTAVSVVQFQITMTYSYDELTFFFGNTAGDIIKRMAKFENGVIVFNNSSMQWDNKQRANSASPRGGTGRFTQYTTHDIVFIDNVSATNEKIYHQYLLPLPAPSGVEPANNAQIQTSMPTLRANADLNMAYAQSQVKMEWQFATDAGFTTNVSTYIQPDSAYKTVNGTDAVGSVVPFVDVLPEVNSLEASILNWYVRAAHVDEYDIKSAWSATNTFQLTHPPAAAAISPNGGTVIAYAATIRHTWTFTDPSPTDFQTAYQIVVERVSDGTIVADTGKVVSGARFADVPIPVAYKNVELRTKISLWDSNNTQGPFSDYVTWVAGDPITLSVTAPTGTVTTSIPNLTANLTFAGDRTVTAFRVQVLQAGVIIYDSGVIGTNKASGSVITWQPPAELLTNNTTYTFQIRVTDTWGLITPYASTTFTTGWAAPATASGQSVSVTPYNTENQGYVEITWTDANRDVDFVKWVVYRKDDLLDPQTGSVLEAGVDKAIATVNTTAATYSYKDYWAPSGYRTTYRIEQQVSRAGGDLRTSSNGAPTSVTPVSDSYWVIDPTYSTAWRLGGVTSDSYTDEYEEEEMFVIGRGRRVETGERMGFSGTLTAQIRDKQGLSARQQKLRLEQLKKESRKLYLRNPFGDIFRVAVKSMQVSRIAGVGTSEFIDVTIPYMEVGE